MSEKPFEYAQRIVSSLKDEEVENISDGYHTFKELYDHRITLFIALCNTNKELYCWKSHFHSDGGFIEGWFIAGINIESGKQITYHLPLSYWDKLDAFILEKAPQWDGHTPDDVAKRLMEQFA